MACETEKACLQWEIDASKRELKRLASNEAVPEDTHELDSLYQLVYDREKIEFDFAEEDELAEVRI